jgi:hypothetical protein
MIVRIVADWADQSDDGGEKSVEESVSIDVNAVSTAP